VPRLAFIGGGTMNVTASWCGMGRAPGENFRQVMRAHRADRLLWREVPLVAVTQRAETRYGFTFGAGPLVRILEQYELGKKSHAKALEIAAKSILGALSGIPRDFQAVLKELAAQITVDGARLPHDRWAAVFANVTGAINPFIEPFTAERTRDSFHFLAYAVSSREFAMMAPLLARGLLPIDSKALLHPISAWRKALMAISGKAALPADPRYINHPARELSLETSENHFTIDGELIPSIDRRIDVRLGPAVHLATLRTRVPRAKPVSAAPA